MALTADEKRLLSVVLETAGDNENQAGAQAGATETVGSCDIAEGLGGGNESSRPIFFMLPCSSILCYKTYTDGLIV